MRRRPTVRRVSAANPAVGPSAYLASTSVPAAATVSSAQSGRHSPVLPLHRDAGPEGKELLCPRAEQIPEHTGISTGDDLVVGIGDAREVGHQDVRAASAAAASRAACSADSSTTAGTTITRSRSGRHRPG